MYIYAVIRSMFDGVSNLYLIIIGTVFLAVIVAFYCGSLLKEESRKQLKKRLQKEGDGNIQENKKSDYLGTNSNEIKNQAKKEVHNLSETDKLENSNDYVDDNHYDNDYMKCNSAYENFDTDLKIDEINLNGLVSKLKSKRVKELEAQLTTDQLEEEKRIEREQLAAIFELLKKQEAELNMKEIDESELNAQLALYR